jgi:ADP-ribose pyrophosphatase
MAEIDLTEHSVSSEQVLDGRLLKVYRDQIRLPDGAPAVREWIDHPGASAVVPLHEDGTVTLVRQYRFPARREFLELPAGKIDHAGDSPERLARRELEEETGLRAGRLELLGCLHPTVGYSSERIHLYLAQDLVQVEQALDEGEWLVVERIPFREAVEMAGMGAIEDMKTAAALLMADARLRDS